MDDPWGSPWASADHSGAAAALPETTSAPAANADVVAADGPQLPPPVLTSIPSLALPSLAEPSPWADDAAVSLGGGGISAESFGGFGAADDVFDDSAFGDWATATPTAGGGGWPSGGLEESPERPQRLSPFAPAKTNGASNSPAAHTTVFFSGDASPIAWPSPTASRSPSRSPSRAPTRSPARSPATSLSAKRAPSLEPGRERPQTPSPEPKRRLGSSTGDDDGHAELAANRDAEDDRGAAAGADSDGDGDDGDDAAEGDDSPITSVDEETPRPPMKNTDEKDAPGRLEPRLPLQRKVSVQQLVEHFDGLATASRRPSPSPSRPEKSEGDAEDGDDDDDDDDFADFEGPDPAAAADVVRPETPVQRSKDRDDEPVSGEEVRTPPAPSPSAASVPSQAATPVRRGRPSAGPPTLSLAKLLDHYGPVGPYTPPASTLDALFAAEEQLLGISTQPAPAPAALDAYVPDHVLTDSFTAISERRVWYRIARAGSSRRNGAGVDDDNYRPITWATSAAVRPDTLRIVRRWVEEDAFTGRATLGGGRGGRRSSGSVGGGGGGGGGGIAGIGGGGAGLDSPGGGRGHLFGWDSTAAPLALDSVYRKKRPKTRPVSLGSNTATAAAPRIVPGPGPGPAAAARPWHHHAMPATRHSVHFTGAQRVGLGLGLASPLSAASSSTPASSASEWTQPALHGGANSPAAVVALPGPGAAAAAADGDDDDWGEMVSSPAVGSGFPGAGSAAAALALGPGPSTPTALPLPGAVSHTQPPPTDADVDRAVAAVLHGLPDLSYMAK